MERAAILDGIERRADLESDAEAERAAVAALRTLGEHVSAGEADDLAESLPQQFGDALTTRSDVEPDGLSPDEFVARVADREGSDVAEDEAMGHVRAVMATLADEGLRDELQAAREQLPDEYATIFDTADLAAE